MLRLLRCVCGTCGLHRRSCDVRLQAIIAGCAAVLAGIGAAATSERCQFVCARVSPRYERVVAMELDMSARDGGARQMEKSGTDGGTAAVNDARLEVMGARAQWEAFSASESEGLCRARSSCLKCIRE